MDLIVWSKECNRILATNRSVIETAQKDIPSFEIYDLEYGVPLNDEESHNLTVHNWVLGRYSDCEGFYRVIDKSGNVFRTLIFYPVSVCAEAVIIEPGPNSSYCHRLDLQGGTLYYGPNVEIDEYIPTLLDLPEKPSAPEELPDWDRVQIETKVESQKWE